MPKGGKREGAGHPTRFQMEQKASEAKEKLTASTARRKAALAAAFTAVEEAASKGERWAVQMLIEHETGRPGQKVQAVADTTIRLVHRWLRKPQPCPHCGKIIRSFEEKPAPVEEVDARAGVDSDPDDWPDPFEETT